MRLSLTSGRVVRDIAVFRPPERHLIKASRRMLADSSTKVTFRGVPSDWLLSRWRSLAISEGFLLDSVAILASTLDRERTVGRMRTPYVVSPSAMMDWLGRISVRSSEL
jgi:hypothetical protein